MNRGECGNEFRAVRALELRQQRRTQDLGSHVFLQILRHDLSTREQVRLCEQIEIQHGSDAVTITDDALFHDDAILCPSGCRGGAVVKQVSPYTGEYDHFDDTACEEDMRRLDRLVRTLRCPDPASVLRCLLQDLPLNEYASLVGKTFRVSLGESADEAAVDLVS